MELRPVDGVEWAFVEGGEDHNDEDARDGGAVQGGPTDGVKT